MKGTLVKISGRNLTFQIDDNGKLYNLTLPAISVKHVDYATKYIGRETYFAVHRGEVVFNLPDLNPFIKKEVQNQFGSDK